MAMMLKQFIQQAFIPSNANLTPTPNPGMELLSDQDRIMQREKTQGSSSGLNLLPLWNACKPHYTLQ